MEEQEEVEVVKELEKFEVTEVDEQEEGKGNGWQDEREGACKGQGHVRGVWPWPCHTFPPTY